MGYSGRADIALLQLRESLIFSHLIQPICLPFNRGEEKEYWNKILRKLKPNKSVDEWCYSNWICEKSSNLFWIFEAQELPETENFPFTDEGVQGQIAGFGHMVPHKVHVSQKMFFKIQ